jgi:hypothetical protein
MAFCFALDPRPLAAAPPGCHLCGSGILVVRISPSLQRIGAPIVCRPFLDQCTNIILPVAVQESVAIL